MDQLIARPPAIRQLTREELRIARRKGPLWMQVTPVIAMTQELGPIKSPAGNLTNGASRPWWAKAVISRWGWHSRAVILHDALYSGTATDWKGNPIRCTRKQADRAMWEIMRQDGVPKWKRDIMYHAVRKGGKKHWKGNS